MRVIEITKPGGPEVLEIREVPDPKAGEGEVVIKTTATALNRADIMQRQGNYPPPPGASLYPGLEVSGTIESVGPGVSKWKVGDQVRLKRRRRRRRRCLACLIVVDGDQFLGCAAAVAGVSTRGEKAYSLRSCLIAIPLLPAAGVCVAWRRRICREGECARRSSVSNPEGCVSAGCSSDS
jgi:NADPH:quinone reductase-like Zn-dependent oxidoreductase